MWCSKLRAMSTPKRQRILDADQEGARGGVPRPQGSNAESIEFRFSTHSESLYRAAALQGPRQACLRALATRARGGPMLQLDRALGPLSVGLHDLVELRPKLL